MTYWPLASSKSFDPQPGNDAHMLVGGEHARNDFRTGGLRVD
jgi:hypothetical protein